MDMRKKESGWAHAQAEAQALHSFTSFQTAHRGHYLTTRFRSHIFMRNCFVRFIDRSRGCHKHQSGQSIPLFSLHLLSRMLNVDYHRSLQERGAVKEYLFSKRLQQLWDEEERLRIPLAQGLPWTTEEPAVCPLISLYLH